MSIDFCSIPLTFSNPNSYLYQLHLQPFHFSLSLSLSLSPSMAKQCNLSICALLCFLLFICQSVVLARPLLDCSSFEDHHEVHDTAAALPELNLVLRGEGLPEKSPEMKVGGRSYGPLFLNMLPKGRPVPGSGPSKRINGVNN